MSNVVRMHPLSSSELSQPATQKVSSINPGFILALLANLLWGASFLASKYTLQAWGPVTASSLRFAIATVAFFVVVTILGKKIEKPKNASEWLSLALIGTSGFGLLYPLQLAGLKYISSSLSAAIMLTSPLIVLVLGRSVLGEKLSVYKWISLALGLIGGSLLLFSKSGSQEFSFNSDFFIGTLFTLASSSCLAFSVIVTRKNSLKFSSVSITFWSMAIGFIELTLAAFIFEENALATLFTNSNLMSWMALIFLALVCSAFCFFIWNAALAKTSPQEIASSMHIKTPTAVIIGLLIANETLGLQGILGTSLVMAGVWLSQRNLAWRKK